MATYHHKGNVSKQPRRHKSSTRVTTGSSEIYQRPPSTGAVSTTHLGQWTCTPHTHGAHAHNHLHTQSHSQPKRTLSHHISALLHPGTPPANGDAREQYPHEARPAPSQTGEGNTGSHTFRTRRKDQQWPGGASKHAWQGP